MPRCFFDIESLAFANMDDVGTDFGNPDLARAAAWRLLIDVIKGNEKFDGRHAVALKIRDERGQTIGCITMASDWSDQG